MSAHIRVSNTYTSASQNKCSCKHTKPEPSSRDTPMFQPFVKRARRTYVYLCRLVAHQQRVDIGRGAQHLPLMQRPQQLPRAEGGLELEGRCVVHVCRGGARFRASLRLACTKSRRTSAHAPNFCAAAIAPATRAGQRDARGTRQRRAFCAVVHTARRTLHAVCRRPGRALNSYRRRLR